MASPHSCSSAPGLERRLPPEEREGGRSQSMERLRLPSVPRVSSGPAEGTSRRKDKLLPDSCSRKSQEVKVDPPVGLYVQPQRFSGRSKLGAER